MHTPIYCVDCHRVVKSLYSVGSRIVGSCNCGADGNYVERMRGPLKEGHIYCIGDGDDSHYVKIGYTNVPPGKRMKELQTGNPRQLRLIGFIFGDIALEAALHRAFDDFRFREEWFVNEGIVKIFSESLASIVPEQIGQYVPKNFVKEIRVKHSKNRLDGPWLAMGISSSSYYRKGYKISPDQKRKTGRPRKDAHISAR